jgi:hypothetical protein
MYVVLLVFFNKKNYQQKVLIKVILRGRQSMNMFISVAEFNDVHSI